MIVLAVFVIFFVVSFIKGIQHPLSLEAFIGNGVAFLTQKSYGPSIAQIVHNSFVRFLFLAITNSLEFFFVIVGGLVLALPTIFITTGSASSLGSTAAYSYHNIGPSYALWSIAPHSVTEIAANVIAAGLGLWLLVVMLKTVFLKQPKQLKPALKYALKLYIVLIIPLTIFSAFMEAYVTPYTSTHFSGNEQAVYASSQTVKQFKLDHPQEVEAITKLLGLTTN